MSQRLDVPEPPLEHQNMVSRMRPDRRTALEEAKARIVREREICKDLPTVEECIAQQCFYHEDCAADWTLGNECLRLRLNPNAPPRVGK